MMEEIANEMDDGIYVTEDEYEDVLIYLYRHPLDSIYELRLAAPDLSREQIATIAPRVDSLSRVPGYLYPSAREIFRYARHTLEARVDARTIEHTLAGTNSDPIYAQLRYRFSHTDRVQFGLTIRRPTSAPARDMQYGAYLQLNHLGPMRTIVVGNYQANFGCGLVVAPAFHLGRTAYVATAGRAREGLTRSASAAGNTLRGAGATATIPLPDRYHLDLTAFYSYTRANDSIRQHVIGANATYRWQQLKIGLTAVAKLYSDSLYYYRATGYNRNYFRGREQAVVGLNFRYNWGRYDLFGEVAAAQSSRTILYPRWGVGANIGVRMVPVSDIELLAVARYYSPTFDNHLGYGLSSTSRVGDEAGICVSADIGCVRYWRWSATLDFYHYTGPKYGIPMSPSFGGDATLRTQYRSRSMTALEQPTHTATLLLRARYRGDRTTASARMDYRWTQGPWTLTSRADLTLAADSLPAATNRRLHLGYALMQDVDYSFRTAPVVLNGRVAAYHVTNWANRIYAYEDDVLGSFSIPALYGQALRAYLNLRWAVLGDRRLVLYFRLSETLYANGWAAQQKMPYRTSTDIHLLLRMTL